MPKLFALTILFIVGGCSASNAALVHRYSFSGNVNDSIGTAHGSIVDPGTVNHAFVDGTLDVQTNRGLPYPQNADGAFVELPGNIFSAAFLGGVDGEITIEMWVEVAALTPWASPFNFGYAAPGKYLHLYSASNSNNREMGVDVNPGPNTRPSPNTNISGTGPLSVGKLSHVAITLQTSPSRPIQTTYYLGDYSVYVDGSLVATKELPTGFQPHDMPGAQLRLGRSVWPTDPFFNGSFDEFRIYDSRLTPEQIAANYALGPNAVPEPQSIALILAAATFATTYRRRSP